LTPNLFGCEKKKERLQKEREQQAESNMATDDTPRATKRRAQERKLVREEDLPDYDEYSPFANLSPLSFSRYCEPD
jgi:hypothetical protein